MYATLPCVFLLSLLISCNSPLVPDNNDPSNNNNNTANEVTIQKDTVQSAAAETKTYTNRVVFEENRGYVTYGIRESQFSEDTTIIRTDSLVNSIVITSHFDTTIDTVVTSLNIDTITLYKEGVYSSIALGNEWVYERKVYDYSKLEKTDTITFTITRCDTVDSLIYCYLNSDTIPYVRNSSGVVSYDGFIDVYPTPLVSTPDELDAMWYWRDDVFSHRINRSYNNDLFRKELTASNGSSEMSASFVFEEEKGLTSMVYEEQLGRSARPKVEQRLLRFTRNN